MGGWVGGWVGWVGGGTYLAVLGGDESVTVQVEELWVGGWLGVWVGGLSK